MALKAASKEVAQAEATYQAAEQQADPARRAGVLQRAGRGGRAGGEPDLPRSDLPPARSGQQALRGRPHRHHRRAGRQGGTRHRRGRRDRRQAHARHHARISCRRSPGRSTTPRQARRRHAAEEPGARRRGAAGSTSRSSRTCRSSPAAWRPTSRATTCASRSAVICRRSTWSRDAPTTAGFERDLRRACPFRRQHQVQRPADRPAVHRADLQRRLHAVEGAPDPVPVDRGQGSGGAELACHRAPGARCLPRRHQRHRARAGAAPGGRIQPHRAEGDRGRLRGRHAHLGRRAQCAPDCWCRRETDYAGAAATTTS